MARSSRPRRPYAPASGFCLYLRQGGEAELLVQATGEVVWSSDEDEDFQLEFGDEFLVYEDVADILDYLEDTGRLSRTDADNCQIVEEFMTPEEYAGLLR